MKISNYFLSVVFFLSTLVVFANPNSIKVEVEDTATVRIETYLSSINFIQDAETVTIFSNFLIMEDGDLYTIDFMLSENGDIDILEMDFEEEYYKVDSFSTQNMAKYTFPVASVNTEKVPGLTLT